MKFCKDCKHYRPDTYRVLMFWTMKGDPKYSRCAAFPSLVSGEAGIFCDIERNSEGLCGKSGALWEPA